MSKIFLSFSGKKSKEKANALRGLLLSVFSNELKQDDIFFSQKSLLPGDEFMQTIRAELKQADVGIIFINNENYLKEPWINYEAGALKSRLDKTTFLFFDGSDNEFNEFTTSKSPLRTIQAQKLNNQPKMLEMLDLIRKKLNMETLRADLNSHFIDNWENFENSLSVSRDRYVANFNQLLRFFIKTVDDLHKDNIKKTDISIPEIWPAHIDKVGTYKESNVPYIDTLRFNSEWLHFSDEFDIAVHLFDENMHSGFRAKEHYIRFVPKNPEYQSEYLNVFYYPDTKYPKLTMRYNIQDSDDHMDFKTYMKKYHNLRNKQYVLDLNIPNNATAYNYFNEMIKYSLSVDTRTGLKVNSAVLYS